MNGKILIVEDEFIVAKDLRIILEKAGYEISGIASSVPKALELIALKKPAWVFLDIQLNGPQTGIDLAWKLNEMEIPFIYVSANSNQSILELAKSTKPYGFLVKPFREKDVLITLDIATYRHEHNLETTLLREMELQVEVMQVIENKEDWKDKSLAILAAFQQHISFDYYSVCWSNSSGAKEASMAFTKERDGNFQYIPMSLLTDLTGKSEEELITAKKAGPEPEHADLFTGEAFEIMCAKFPYRKILSRSFDLGSLLLIPVKIEGKGTLIYSFYSHDNKAYDPKHLVLIERLSLLLVKIAAAMPMRPTNTNGPTSPYPEAGSDHTDRTANETKGSYELENDGLIGSGAEFELVKQQLATVAPFEISVLILGESGTGKEKIAQTIHLLSARKMNPLVKVNCAAIPATLMESELFGHEKGAFTGAQSRRIGKFEQAIGGTIFLDEIGELPLDLQVKLLCVLQEKEIVRLGSNQVIKTDVRVIAATNRNLEKEVAEGRFRLDLYYRLNVFPIMLPSLRDRINDIDQLAPYFLKKISNKIGKNVSSITPAVLEELKQYDWPGNIRELENLLERTVLLTIGSEINEIALPEKAMLERSTYSMDAPVKTIKELEKEHILKVLKKVNGRVGGAGGAAELLDIAPTTLLSKLNKLGIVKKHY